MTTTTTSAPAWARGYDVALLRQYRDVFRQHDGSLPLGAFTSVGDNTVAEWLHTGELHDLAPTDGLVVARTLRANQSVRGWNGQTAVRLLAGDLMVKRMAWRTADGMAAVRRWLADADSDRAVLIEACAEHTQQQALLASLGARVAGQKIRASSEIFSLHLLGAPRQVEVPDAAEVAALGTLAVKPLEYRLPIVGAELQAAGLGWADHYSAYNARHAWSAVSLTGYAPPGEAPSADRIEKPSEMSRGWQAEHPDWREWTLGPTPLRAALPLTWALLQTLPGIVACHRVRLMRLAPGGGELTRHSDITDPDAGTADGQFMRLHLPLITNPGVIFQQWLLDGTRVAMAMPLGQWCYIDTRKAHTARNGGTADRIHLVADVAATADLRAALLAGTQAQPASARKG